MFGRNCQQSCGADMYCKGLRFCLPDPYGCSCASGWFGSRCEKGQPPKTGRLNSPFFQLGCHSCSLRRQPVTTTCTDRTASSAAAARTEECATASVGVSVRQGGGATTARNRVRAKKEPRIEKSCVEAAAVSLSSFSPLTLTQTGLRRSWIWKVIWKEISTQAPRFIVPPLATRCPATTASSCENQTAPFSR